MNQSPKSLLRISPARALGLLAATIGLAVSASPAVASQMSFDVTMAEDSSVVADPMNMTTMMMAGWQTEHALMVARGRPYVQITNTSDTANMTKFSLALPAGQASLYSFDFAKVVTYSPGVTWSLDAPLTATPMQGISDLVTFHFTGAGLTPGEYFRFQSGIVADPGNNTLFPDYRLIFVNYQNPRPDSQNSFLLGTFDTGGPIGGNLTNSFVMGPPPVPPAAPFAPHGSDAVHALHVSFGGTPLPEPSSIVLGAFGGLGFLVYGVRRKRAQKRFVASA